MSSYPSSTDTTTHVLTVLLPAVGHARPVLGLIFKLAKRHPDLVFTVLAHKAFINFVNDEVHRAGLTDDIFSRLRILGVSDNDNAQMGDVARIGAEMALAVETLYKKLLNGEDLVCTATGKAVQTKALPRPNVVLTDIFLPWAGKAVKDLTPDVNLILCWPSGASSFIRHYAPPEMDGLGEWERMTNEAVEKGALVSQDGKAGGRTLTQVADSLLYERAHLVSTPDGVTVHEYELHPQLLPPIPIAQTLFDSTRQALGWADGVLLAMTADYEPKSTTALLEWYEGRLGKKVFFTGPQVGNVLLQRTIPKSVLTDVKHKDVFDFLDRHPPNSVVLISFGTIFYPVLHPGHIVVLLRTLLSNGTPFIFSRAAAMYAPIPEDLEKAIESSGLGLLKNFVPQQEVLVHKSMAAMITHGGGNSTNEIIHAGIVGIFWPFMADQPMFAAYMTMNLDCGFELLQVRTGPGAGPPYRGGVVHGTEDAIAAELNDVFDQLKGDVGKRKWKNAQALRERTLDAIGAGGTCERAQEELVALFKDGRKHGSKGKWRSGGYLGFGYWGTSTLLVGLAAILIFRLVR